MSCVIRKHLLFAQLTSAYVFATKIVQFLDFLNPKFQHLVILRGCTAGFVSDLVGNTEDRFSSDVALLLADEYLHFVCWDNIYYSKKFCIT